MPTVTRTFHDIDDKRYYCFKCEGYTYNPTFVQVCYRALGTNFAGTIQLQFCPDCLAEFKKIVSGFVIPEPVAVDKTTLGRIFNAHD